VDSLKNKRFNYLVLFAISLLTLSRIDFNLYSGLDGSYFWAFNYLLNFKAAELDKITFIYGPLAFLLSPAYYGPIIIITCIFQLAIKFFTGKCFLRLSQLLGIDDRIAFVLFLGICLTMYNPQAYINLLIILLLIIHYHDQRPEGIIWVAFLTAFAYYYKCSAGLAAVLYQLIYLVYTGFLAKKADPKTYLKFFALNSGIWFIIGLLLFRGVKPVFTSLITYYQNVIAFGEASSLYNGTGENFILLSLCFLCIFAVWFINKDKVFRLFWLMAIVFLYTSYTHSIVRMDHSHYMGFLLAMLFVILTSILFSAKISRYTFILLGVSFFCYYGNAGTKRDYNDLIINIPNGPKNFINYVFNYPTLKLRSQKQSALNLKYNNALDHRALSEIREGTVDFFPWDLMYVEAHDLKNWKPRPYLQNLNMSSYFDKRTGDHFASAEAPDNLVWHGGDATEFLRGIDNSYTLNNEFHSIMSILKNYKASYLVNNALILKKRSAPLKIKEEDLGKETQAMSGEWINLPQSDAILGCSINYDFNMLRGLKKLVYRDDEFFIEYRTAANLKIKKRIWPGDADEFVWLDPYISKINDSTAYRNITQVRFLNTNKVIHSGALRIQFKTLKFEGNENKKAIYEWFRGRF
jgi:hypothetical protein